MTPGFDDPSDAYLVERLLEMLAIPSITGFTDELSRYLCAELQALGVEFQLTRRGSIIARVPGKSGHRYARAVVNHLDTIGATVKALKPNGRLAIAPVGTWSSRFAEGGRVTVFTSSGAYRGQVLPLLASGHAFNEEVDRLPISWNQIEVRVNERAETQQDLRALGVEVGDYVAFDADPEVSSSGYISARHLDNKAGAAALLCALKQIRQERLEPEIDLHAIFTVTEEVGTGAGATLSDRVSEFVGIDIGPVAPGQNARETGVTICAQDTSGPYDFHLRRKLTQLCRSNNIPYQVDVFRYYYSDANSAVTAGHDVHDALLTFGTDATHGYERTHMDSLRALVRLLVAYSASTPVFPARLSGRREFPHQIESQESAQ
ncbi:MAG: osmoprotectant NAGGN system M42 family peptidase [Pseudomonadota bacterium]|nr:osmoprotectant NAGGN system M42 family peptidase [Pseudomonadota bacterium]